MLLIGTNERLKTTYATGVEIKKTAILEAMEFFSLHQLTTTSKELIDNGFLNDFQTKYLKEYTKHIPKYLKGLEALKFANINLSFLVIRQSNFNSVDVPFDIENLSLPGEVDFGIYLEGTQLEKWEALENLQTAITEFNAKHNGYDFINFGSIPMQLTHKRNLYFQV